MYPVLFSIPTPWGVVPVYSYGVMLGAGLLASWIWTIAQGQRRARFDPDFMGSVFMYGVVGALTGARLLYVATNLDQFHSLGQVLNLRSGGMVAYGGFLGAYFTTLVVFRWKRAPMLPLVDIAAPSIGLGFLISRLGCYLYGCDYGMPLAADAPSWLKRLGTFPQWDSSYFRGLEARQEISGSPAFSHHMHDYAVQMIGRTDSLPVHPTQLYESTMGLVIFIVGFIALQRKRFDGQVLICVTATYAVWRFCIEFLRGDLRRGEVLGFTTSQWISLILLVACAVAWRWLSKRQREGRQPAIPAHVLLRNE